MHTPTAVFDGVALRLAGADTTVPGIRAYNPAFDVTPADLITAIVTEQQVGNRQLDPTR